MMERLEATLDAPSTRRCGRSPDDLTEQLRKYLADAHAIEEQAIALLERARSSPATERLARIYEEHLAETREHAELVEARLNALGGDPSTLKDAALRLGALNWAAFFRGHPDTPGKLAAFACAFEHLEIGGYEQLKRVAQTRGRRRDRDARGADPLRRSGGRGADRRRLRRAVDASLEAVGVRTSG